MHKAYAPADSLATKVMRRVTPLLSRRPLSFTLDRPMVSFSFDDCPQSAVTHGFKPLEREGWRGTAYIAAGLFGTVNHHGAHMTADDVVALHESGHEIGGHSYSHIDGNLTPDDEFLADVTRNEDVLEGLGLPRSRTFAYPYGEVTAALKSALEADYTGLRGIQPKPMYDTVDLNQIASTPVFRGQEFDTAIAQIKSLADKPGWVTLFMHDIQDTPSQWGCTPAQMQAVINAVKDINATVLPIAEAITTLKEQG